MSELREKIDFAIDLLRHIPQDCEIELAYSGGKDSDVILELAKMAGIKFRPLYKNTTIDPPGTIAHVKEMGVEIVQPEIKFLDIIKKKGMPTRRARFCCSDLKEYKICERAILGIRRAESSAREENYKEPEICRVYSKKEKVIQYFPILNWTNEDIEQFIVERNIKCAPSYYDSSGKFHVERRLGCIGCPMQSDNGIEDFKQYPKMLKAVIRSLQIYFDTHKHVRSYKKFRHSPYHAIVHNLFYDNYEDYDIAVTGGIFPETSINPKKFLEDYFKIDLTI